MNEIISLLTDRRDRVDLDSDKSYHLGMIELKRWEKFPDEMPIVLVEALCYMQKSFHTITASCDTGTINLTATTQAIGDMFASYIGTYDMTARETWDIKANIGAAILDTIWRLDYIAVEREATGQYQIHARDKWHRLKNITIPGTTMTFRGMSNHKPKDIDSFLLPNRKPLIKRTYEDKFSKLDNSIHLAGCNKISQTGWRTNIKVLEGVLKHPWDNYHPPIPAEGNKALVDKLQESMKKDPTLTEEYDKQRALWEAKKLALGIRSRIMERILTIEKMVSLMDEQHFYFYVNSDYRSRVYYIEPYVNYQGDDLSKGLLEFSSPREMTDRGRWWQLLNAATCYNETTSSGLKVDKLSLEERVAWSTDNFDLIVSTAENLTIHDEAEKPVQFLAACLDIIQAAETGLTYLPISVDGSQNGGQHASAINKDRETGVKVGLTDIDRPMDLYVLTGQEMVRRAPEFFAERGMTIGDIRSNMSKRACMVRQYSAGKKSISNNMYSDCHKQGATVKYNITPNDCDYLAKIALASIDVVCPANATLRDYLKDIVKHELGTWDNKLKAIVAGNGAKTITWTSPAGFPIDSKLSIQHSISTKITVAGKRIRIRGKWDTNIPDMRKHLSSIAANVVHAQDSSHLTSVAAHWPGDSFGAVHDSFAVHAPDVDDLIDLIKDEFIEMYEHPNYYEVIRDSILSSTENFTTPLPEVGDFDLEEIRTAPFFFC